MSYTELDYLQEEVLGYFTEDKNDINYDVARRREIETKSGDHNYNGKFNKTAIAFRHGKEKVVNVTNNTDSKDKSDKELDTQTDLIKNKDNDRRKNRNEKKAQHPEHGSGNKNDRKRARKAEQNEKSTNESALAYDILNLFESEATDDICTKCSKRKCICDRTSKNECGSKC